jgi:hypothetical protein
MSESTWWNGTVRPALLRVFKARELPHRVDRVENLCSPGMADTSMTVDGFDVWVELKLRRRGHVKVQKQQPTWHQRHAEAGGVSFVLVKGDRCVEVHRGTDLPWLKTPLARFAQPIDWDGVADVLLGGVL